MSPEFGIELCERLGLAADPFTQLSEINLDVDYLYRKGALLLLKFDEKVIAPLDSLWGELYRTLGKGGVVNVATDDEDYFVQIRKVMAEKFAETAPEVLPAEAMTEFEKVFVAAGKPIGRARFSPLSK